MGKNKQRRSINLLTFSAQHPTFTTIKKIVKLKNSRETDYLILKVDNHRKYKGKIYVFKKEIPEEKWKDLKENKSYKFEIYESRQKKLILKRFELGIKKECEIPNCVCRD